MFTSRNDFTNLFVIYSQHLESLISLDCKNQPDNFYYELENVRFLRDKLETSVAKTNNIITSHLQAVDQLRHNLNNSAKKTEQELGGQFRPFEETLLDTVRWYRNHGYLN